MNVISEFGRKCRGSVISVGAGGTCRGWNVACGTGWLRTDVHGRLRDGNSSNINNDGPRRLRELSSDVFKSDVSAYLTAFRRTLCISSTESKQMNRDKTF